MCGNVVDAQLSGVTAIRRLLSKESQPPVKEVLACGILPKLIELIVSPDVKIGFEAAWAVTNIASTEYTAHVVDAGAVRPLVAGMMSGDTNVRDQCLWCLGNIAGDCSKYRDLLLGTEGALSALFLNIQQPASLQLLRNATWALSNFCRGKPSPSPEAVRALLPALAYLLNHEDKETLGDAAWGVSYLTDGDEATVQAFVDTPGVLTRCVALMEHAESTIVTPALRIMGNVISGSDRQTQAAVEAGALRAIAPLLSHSKKTLRREACWAVSNVAAGTVDQISALMSVPGLIAGVLGLLRSGEFAVRKEAAWVMSNIATTGSATHVHALVALRVADPLCDIIKCGDARIQCLVLDCIKTILTVGAAGGSSNPFADVFEEAGLLDRLEDVQSGQCHSDVYERAVGLIERFFGVDEDVPYAEASALAGLKGMDAANTAFSLSGPVTFGANAGFGANANWGAVPAGPTPFNFGSITFA